MKKMFFWLMTFLISISVMFADQTFISESAILENVYYSVPVDVTIQESNTPTDFYVSVGSGTFWQQFSTEFDWGDFNPATTVRWTPTELYNGVYLGIHTGVRNSGTFTELPTDLSDVAITVKTGSMTITGPEEVWYDDIFYYSWDAVKTTLPEELIFQYNAGSGWITLDTIAIQTTNGITLHNEFAHSDYSVRFTYLGSAYGFTLAEWFSTFNNYSFEITNRNEIESTLYDDGEVVVIEYAKERLSEYTYVTAEVDGKVIDIIEYNENTTLFTTPLKKDASTVIYFYDEEGNYITDITINSNHKFFEVSPLTDEEYSVNDVIPFVWSYSDHFELVSTSVLRNSNTIGFEVINSDWKLTRAYNYAVIEADTTLIFRFTVSDGHTTIIRDTRMVTAVGHCKAGELQIIIDSLEIQLAESKKIIESLSTKVDSLKIYISEISPDIIYVTLIKDLPNRVEIEKEFLYSKTTTLTISNDVCDMGIYNLEYVYIIDTTGKKYEAIWSQSLLYTDTLISGAYFIIAIDSNGKIWTFKFIK